jgi:UDP-glucose-4-epimerase GalE
MTILVTGGAGYIGSVVCELLEAEGHVVIVIDDLRDGNKQAVSPNSAFFVASCGNGEILEQIFTRYSVDVVLHLAAMANVPDSVAKPLDYYDANVTDTVHLLRAMKNLGVKRIIFSSTAAVYGEPETTPIAEEHPLHPVNPYGFSKLVDEQILRDCAVAYGINYIAFRYFCAAGATPFHGESRKHETHLIPVVVDAALKRRPAVSVYGTDYPTKDGSGVRDYVHVIDIARAHLRAMSAIDEKPNRVFNLGTGSGYSVKEVIAIAAQCLGTEIPWVLAPRREGDPGTLVASYERARRELQWEPTHELKAIIESAYAWRTHPLY